MKTSIAGAIALVIILGTGYFVMNGTGTPDSISVTQNNSVRSEVGEGSQNSVIKDGVQYVAIVAHGGYSPRMSFAVAGIPTKFSIKTDGTYDCSLSLFIPSLNFRKMLPNTGETIVDAGTPKAGTKVTGVCGMGMYSFVVDFK